MRRAIANMNPFLRGLAIVALIAVVVVVLQLQATLVALGLLVRIAFFLAIAFFLYMVWRERQQVRGRRAGDPAAVGDERGHAGGEAAGEHEECHRVVRR